MSLSGVIARVALVLVVAAGAAGWSRAEGPPARDPDPPMMTERPAPARAAAEMVYYGRMGAPFLPKQGTVLVVRGAVVQPARARRSDATCPPTRHATAPKPATGSGA